MMVFRSMDTGVVINEVKKRECLWNPRCVHYKNKMDKYKAWEEVCEVVLPKFTACNENDQGHIVRAVQSRWKTARDAYMKCRLTETKKPTYKSRQHKYIYQEQLRFLEAVKHMEECNVRDGECKVRDDEGDSNSNSFVAENSTSQSAFGAADDDSAEEREGLTDFDIEIHDDFKDKIKEKVAGTEVVPDKPLNDDTNQEAESSTKRIEQKASRGTIQQARKRPRVVRARNTKKTMTEFEIKLLKILRSKNSTSTNTSNLQADDQFFFNSLASLLNNFNTHQKLKFRSKILEVVMDVGNISSTTNVKQERETYVLEDFEESMN